jgi:hypothetical protein
MPPHCIFENQREHKKAYMKYIFTAIVSLNFLPVFLTAQNSLNLNINLDQGREINFNASGGNSERMYYRFTNGSVTIPDEVLNDMFNLGDQVLRWPGGATANFYHYKEGTAKGYGLSRYEVEFFNHTMSCNAPRDGTDNCMTFDMAAPRNYLYDLLDYCDKYYQVSGKKKRLVWIPNLLVFFVYDVNQISLLDKANNWADIEQMVANGEISAGFRDRIKENLDVYEILLNHPSIDLVGIEYGNELYFHPPVVILGHDATNALPKWLFESTKDRLYRDMQPGISRLRSIIEIHKKLLKPEEKGIKTGIPVSIIPHTGNQANFNSLYNSFVRDSLIRLADALIHHFYFKVDGNDVDPYTIMDDPTALDQMKTVTDEFIHTRIPKVDFEYEKYFKMKENNIKMWMTEFNLKHGNELVGANVGFQRLWMNMFYHTYFMFESFLSFLDNSYNSDLVEYAFKHLLVGRYDDYNYAGYSVSVNADGTYNKIKRASYTTFEVLGGLTDKKLYKLDFVASNALNLQRKDLLIRAYYEPPQPGNPATAGTAYILYSNKSGSPVIFNLYDNVNFFNGPYFMDTIIRKPSFARYASAPSLNSSNGRTLTRPTNPEVENIKVTNLNDIDPFGDFTIPAYAVGYLAMPLALKTTDTALERPKSVNLSIYPNPSNNLISIRALTKNSFSWNTGNFVISDMLGRPVSARIAVARDQFLQLDISGLAAGVYTITYQQDGQTAVGRFVKQ